MITPKNVIDLLKKDDEKTIRKLYDENKKGFLIFANRYHLDAEDVLDIYQDAVIALIENAKKGKIDDLQSSVSTYLFGIGKFMVFQKLKKEKKTFSKDDFSNLEYVDEGYNEDENNIQVILLQHAFNKLGDQCRKVLQLFYYEEKNLDEIQKILEYSNKDVLKSQKSRCLKQLKDLTKEN
ncbi:sigma-70 family RNA polymerase sigma factor [Flavobacterium sp. TP390]|uniref:Sigma-70 family RNA polymerase sigma factor n=1 Tax=Flavobacterium profundi TaxID=1774945 RepID=A0A6I4ITI4_9FLAO|nr:sigma-70 family RNA polymerase sigma factor [Flavobacterium profundi]MVO10182.1 sigma-70 family RNA polymerase sigma factor [Flavobacterium profundi]